jgi:hypothetical protein
MVRVLRSAIRCNSNPLNLQWLSRKGQTKKERKEERSKGFNEIRNKKRVVIRYTDLFVIIFTIKYRP